MTRVLLIAACIVTAASAADQKLMHCFYFTPIAEATEADWQAFFKATDALPGKIPGLTAVWYGKLRSPLTVFQPTSPDTRKQFTDTNNTASGEFRRVVRQWGVCMAMNGEEALKTYAGHPAHKEWEKSYEKVRQPGTNTLDIVGQ